MGKKKTFLVNNTPVDVEEQDIKDFLKYNKTAIEAKSYIVGNDTVDVAIGDIPDFVAHVKDAKPLFDDGEPQTPKSPKQDNPYAPQANWNAKTTTPMLPTLPSTPEDATPDSDAEKLKALQAQYDKWIGEKKVVKSHIETLKTNQSDADATTTPQPNIVESLGLETTAKGSGVVDRLIHGGITPQDQQAEIKDWEKTLNNMTQSVVENTKKQKEVLQKQFAKDIDNNYKDFLGIAPVGEIEVVNPRMVQEYTDKLMAKMGIPQTTERRDFIKNAVTEYVSSYATYKRITPDAEKRFAAIYGKPLAQAAEEDGADTEAAKKITALDSSFVAQSKFLATAIKNEHTADIDQVSKDAQQLGNDLQTQWAAVDNDFKQRAEALTKQSAQMTQEQFNAASTQFQKEYEAARAEKYDDYKMAFEAVLNQERKINNSIKSDYERRQSILESQYVANRNKIVAEHKNKPHSKKFIDAYAKAFDEAFAADAKSKVDKVNKYQEEHGRLAALGNSFVASTAASVRNLANTLGLQNVSDGMEFIQSAYQLSPKQVGDRLEGASVNPKQMANIVLDDLFSDVGFATAGQIAGSGVTGMAIAGLSAYTGNVLGVSEGLSMAVGGFIMWGQETNDIQRSIYDEVYTRTGDVQLAQSAADESIKAQLPFLVISGLDMLPFMPDASILKKVIPNNVLRKAAVVVGEQAGQTSQEIAQNAVQNYLTDPEHIYEQKDWAKADDYLTKKLIAQTTLQTLPMMGQTMLMTALSSKYPKSDKTLVKEFMARNKVAERINELGDNFGIQQLTQYYDVLGAPRTLVMLSALQAQGKLTPEKQAQLTTAILNHDNHVVSAEKLGFTGGKKYAYTGLRQALDAIDQDIAKAKDDTEKGIHEQRKKMVNGLIQQLVTTGDADIVLIRNKNGVQFTLTEQEALRFLSEDGMIEQLQAANAEVIAMGATKDKINAVIAQSVEKANEKKNTVEDEDAKRAAETLAQIPQVTEDEDAKRAAAILAEVPQTPADERTTIQEQLDNETDKETRANLGQQLTLLDTRKQHEDKLAKIADEVAELSKDGKAVDNIEKLTALAQDKKKIEKSISDINNQLKTKKDENETKAKGRQEEALLKQKSWHDLEDGDVLVINGEDVEVSSVYRNIGGAVHSIEYKGKDGKAHTATLSGMSIIDDKGIPLHVKNKGEETQPKSEKANPISDTNKEKQEPSLLDYVDEKVKYNGEIGYIRVDEGGKITFENNNVIKELIGNEIITPYRVSVKGSNVNINGNNFEIISVNKDGNDNVVSVSLKNDKGLIITKRDSELALDIAIQQAQETYIAKNNVTIKEQNKIVKDAFDVHFGLSISEIFETIPEIVVDAISLMDNDIVALAPDEIQIMLLEASRWATDAIKKIEKSDATKAQKKEAIGKLNRFNKDLNKHYGKVDKQKQSKTVDVAKREATQDIGKAGEEITKTKGEEAQPKSEKAGVESPLPATPKESTSDKKTIEKVRVKDLEVGDIVTIKGKDGTWKVERKTKGGVDLAHTTKQGAFFRDADDGDIEGKVVSLSEKDKTPTTPSPSIAEPTSDKKDGGGLGRGDVNAKKADIKKRKEEELELRNSIIPQVTGSKSYRESINDPNSINKGVWASEKEAEDSMWIEMQEVSDWIDSMVENNIPVQKIIDKVGRLIGVKGKASWMLLANERERLYRFIKAKSESKVTESLIDILRSSREEISAKYDAEYIDKVKQGEFTKQQAKDALKEIGRLTPELEKQIDNAELAELDKAPSPSTVEPTSDKKEGGGLSEIVAKKKEIEDFKASVYLRNAEYKVYGFDKTKDENKRNGYFHVDKNGVLYERYDFGAGGIVFIEADISKPYDERKKVKSDDAEFRNMRSLTNKEALPLVLENERKTEILNPDYFKDVLAEKNAELAELEKQSSQPKEGGGLGRGDVGEIKSHKEITDEQLKKLKELGWGQSTIDNLSVNRLNEILKTNESPLSIEERKKQLNELNDKSNWDKIQKAGGYENYVSDAKIRLERAESDNERNNIKSDIEIATRLNEKYKSLSPNIEHPIRGGEASDVVDFAKRKMEMQSEYDKLQKERFALAKERDEIVGGGEKYRTWGKKQTDAKINEIRDKQKNIDEKQIALRKELKVIEAKEKGSVELFDHYNSGTGSPNTIIYDIRNNKLLERENVVRGKTREVSIEDAARNKFANTLRGRNEREINEAYTEKVKAKYESEIIDEINNYKKLSPSTVEPAKGSEMAQAKAAVKKAWDDMKSQGIIYNPQEDIRKQAALYKALLALARAAIKQAQVTLKEFIARVRNKPEYSTLSDDHLATVYAHALLPPLPPLKYNSLSQDIKDRIIAHAEELITTRGFDDFDAFALKMEEIYGMTEEDARAIYNDIGNTFKDIDIFDIELRNIGQIREHFNNKVMSQVTEGEIADATYMSNTFDEMMQDIDAVFAKVRTANPRGWEGIIFRAIMKHLDDKSLHAAVLADRFVTYINNYLANHDADPNFTLKAKEYKKYRRALMVERQKFTQEFATYFAALQLLKRNSPMTLLVQQGLLSAKKATRAKEIDDAVKGVSQNNGKPNPPAKPKAPAPAAKPKKAAAETVRKNILKELKNAVNHASELAIKIKNIPC